MGPPSIQFASKDAWKVLSDEVVFQHEPWIRLRKQSLKLPKGNVVDSYYQIDIPDFVTVLAITEQAQAVCLRQYKHGARQQCLSFPGGMVDSNETPLEAAQRELLEESGYAGGMWTHLGCLVVNGNSRICNGHFFVAKGVRYRGKVPSDDLEDLDIDELPISTLKERVVTGEIRLLNHAAVLGLASLFGEI